jgi:hypothetical protein
MIDGLKLTFSGDELRTLLEHGMQRHEERARRWTFESRRTQDDDADDAPLLPSHMCENEAERHAWRATVLGFIRDHIARDETYRLGSADLEYGELLPERPGWVEQDEYEQRTRIGFNLERLVKSVDNLGGPFWRRRSESPDELDTSKEATSEEDDGFQATRLDVEAGPEINAIERT